MKHFKHLKQWVALLPLLCIAAAFPIRQGVLQSDLDFAGYSGLNAGNLNSKSNRVGRLSVTNSITLNNVTITDWSEITGVGGSATNAVGTISSNGVVIAIGATNINFIPGDNTAINITNHGGLVDVFIETTGGSGTISGTDTHVLFFDGTDNPAGEAAFTYNKTTDLLSVPNFRAQTANFNNLTVTNGGSFSNFLAVGAQAFKTNLALINSIGHYFTYGARTNESFIAGDNSLSSDATNSALIAGLNNSIVKDANRAVIIAGQNNIIASGTLGANADSVIIGGFSNSMAGISSNNIIIGGVSNRMNYGTIAYGTFLGMNTIIGGSNNVIGNGNASAVAIHGLILGGQNNFMPGEVARGVIVGGFGNVLQAGTDAVILGGIQNTNGGEQSTIGYGKDNFLSGSNSFAGGYRAYSDKFGGVFIISDGQEADFIAAKNDSMVLRFQGGVGINTANPNSALTVIGGISNSTYLSTGTFTNRGGIVVINGAVYAFPSSNAAGSLTNDGSGNLSWGLVAGGSGSDPNAVKTNAGTYTVGSPSWTLRNSNDTTFQIVGNYIQGTATAFQMQQGGALELGVMRLVQFSNQLCVIEINGNFFTNFAARSFFSQTGTNSFDETVMRGYMTLGGERRNTWPSSSADNLGNHTASQNLSLAGFDLIKASNIEFTNAAGVLSRIGLASGAEADLKFFGGESFGDNPNLTVRWTDGGGISTPRLTTPTISLNGDDRSSWPVDVVIAGTNRTAVVTNGATYTVNNTLDSSIETFTMPGSANNKQIHGFIAASNYFFGSSVSASPSGGIYRWSPTNLTAYIKTNIDDNFHDRGFDICYATNKGKLYVPFEIRDDNPDLDNIGFVVTAFDPETLDWQNVITNYDGVGSPPSITCDETFLYVAAAMTNNTSRIYQYKLSDYSSNFSITLPSPCTNIHALRYYQSNVYASGFNSPAWFVKVTTNFSAFTTNGNYVVWSAGGGITDDFDFANNYAFPVTESSPGQIWAINLSDLSIRRVATGGAICYGTHYDGKYVWGFYATTPGTLLRVDPITGEVGKYITHVSQPNEMAHLGNIIAVTGWADNPLKIERIFTPGLTLIEVVNSNFTLANIESAAVQSLGTNSYSSGQMPISDGGKFYPTNHTAFLNASNIFGKLGTNQWPITGSGGITVTSTDQHSWIIDGSGISVGGGDFVPRSGTNMTGGLTNDTMFSGNGRSITNINPTNFVGQLQIVNFNGGTLASSQTFWNGAGQWATPAMNSGTNTLAQGNTINLVGNVTNLASLSTLSFTNNGLPFFVTNNTPNIAAPNGSLAVTTGGAFYIRTNDAWVQIATGAGGGGSATAGTNTSASGSAISLQQNLTNLLTAQFLHNELTEGTTRALWLANQTASDGGANQHWSPAIEFKGTSFDSVNDVSVNFTNNIYLRTYNGDDVDIPHSDLIVGNAVIGGSQHLEDIGLAEGTFSLGGNLMFYAQGGVAHFPGKIEADGGLDPTYLQLQLLERGDVKAEIDNDIKGAPKKKSFAHLVWSKIGTNRSLEIYVPEENTFYTVPLKVAAKNVAPNNTGYSNRHAAIQARIKDINRSASAQNRIDVRKKSVLTPRP